MIVYWYASACGIPAGWYMPREGFEDVDLEGTQVFRIEVAM